MVLYQDAKPLTAVCRGAKGVKERDINSHCKIYQDAKPLVAVCRGAPNKRDINSHCKIKFGMYFGTVVKCTLCHWRAAKHNANVRAGGVDQPFS